MDAEAYRGYSSVGALPSRIGRDRAHGVPVRRLRICFFFVDLEQMSCFVEVKEVSVYDELVFACVGGDLVNALNGVAMLAKLLNEKVDVYHGDQYTRGLEQCGYKRPLDFSYGQWLEFDFGPVPLPI
jgi:hypothetical protein